MAHTTTQPREHAVPCAWCRSMTWNSDAVCDSDGCQDAEERSRLRREDRMARIKGTKA